MPSAIVLASSAFSVSAALTLVDFIFLIYIRILKIQKMNYPNALVFFLSL
jgi:hypothetical protein